MSGDELLDEFNRLLGGRYDSADMRTYITHVRKAFVGIADLNDMSDIDVARIALAFGFTPDHLQKS